MKNLMLFFLLITFHSAAQKQIERQIEGELIETILVNGDNVFKIKVNTQQDPVVKIKTFIQGEHSNYIELITEITNNKLSISTQWHPLFVPNNDKLSAHKVISIELEIIMPEAINLSVKSDIASAILKGKYNHLELELVNGNCNLETQASRTQINTIDGNIEMLTKNTTIKAVTKNGKKSIDTAVLGKNITFLNSLNGDIKVKTKR